jgi:hypothetical protein
MQKNWDGEWRNKYTSLRSFECTAVNATYQRIFSPVIGVSKPDLCRPACIVSISSLTRYDFSAVALLPGRQSNVWLAKRVIRDAQYNVDCVATVRWQRWRHRPCVRTRPTTYDWKPNVPKSHAVANGPLFSPPPLRFCRSPVELLKPVDKMFHGDSMHIDRIGRIDLKRHGIFSRTDRSHYVLVHLVYCWLIRAERLPSLKVGRWNDADIQPCVDQ